MLKLRGVFQVLSVGIVQACPVESAACDWPSLNQNTLWMQTSHFQCGHITLACNVIFLPENPNNGICPKDRCPSEWWPCALRTESRTVVNPKEVASVPRVESKELWMWEGWVALPKLGALCKVMSRITLVPKQDHIKRNCWATFFRDPGLLAATYKKMNSFNSGWLGLLQYSLKNNRNSRVSKFSPTEKWLQTFCFMQENCTSKMQSHARTQCTQQLEEPLTWLHEGSEVQSCAFYLPLASGHGDQSSPWSSRLPCLLSTWQLTADSALAECSQRSGLGCGLQGCPFSSSLPTFTTHRSTMVSSHSM